MKSVVQCLLKSGENCICDSLQTNNGVSLQIVEPIPYYARYTTAYFIANLKTVESVTVARDRLRHVLTKDRRKSAKIVLLMKTLSNNIYFSFGETSF